MIWFLIFLVVVALVVLAYILGAVRNIRKPTANHQEMVRLLQHLLEQDQHFPLLPPTAKETAESLLDDYYEIPKPKEIR